jgi:Helicase conserved C-terminal domain
MPPSARETLTTYQRAFVDQFLAPESERAHLLIAPPGSGVSQCVVEIVTQIMKDTPAARVVLLSDRTALQQQWLHRLEEVSDLTRIMEGSRGNLREISRGGPDSEIIWPEASVVVMASRFIERFHDLKSSAIQTPWDLVIWDWFDSANTFPASARLEMLREFGLATTVGRMLVVSQTANRDALEQAAPWLNRTVWDVLVMNSSGENPKASITFETLVYQRTQAEVNLREHLEEFSKKWTIEPLRSAPGSRLIRAANSSPFALQEQLNQLRPSKASIALGEIRLDEDMEPQEIGEENEYPNLAPSQLSLVATEVRSIQELLDDLPADSKLEALVKYLLNIMGNHPHTLIACRYVATAQYLKSALADLDRGIFLVGPGSPAKDRTRVVSDFEKNRGGILVTTTAAMQGIDAAADLIILYDGSRAALHGALNFVSRPTATQEPVKLVFFVDDLSNADPMKYVYERL